MAHCITSTDGAIYTSQAWHGHGIVRTDLETLSATEAAEAAGILWTPVLCPLRSIGVGPLDGADADVPTEVERIVDLDGSEVPNGAPAYRAVRRSDSGALLSIVGSNYEPLGPSALASILDAAGVRVCNALTLRGGRDVVFTVAGAPFEVRTAAGIDRIRDYTVLADNLDMSRRFLVLRSTFRPDCANMLARAVRSGQVDLSAKHTRRSMDLAVQGLRKALQAADAESVKGAQLAQALAQVRLDGAARREYWLSLYRATGGKAPTAPKTEAEMEQARKAEGFVLELQSHLDAPDAALADRGSAWGALQAATRYATHARTVRRGAQGATVDAARTYSNLLGTSAAFSATAETLAAEMVGAS